MQVLLNKKEKEQLVIDLHQQGKTIREIAQQSRMSFGDIGKISRTLDGHDDDANANCCSNKSKATRALYLIKTGKKPIEIAIELDLPSNEVDELQQEFWALNQLPEVAFLHNEIKNYLPSFLKLDHYLKDRRMLSEKHISKFLKYADHDLPELTNKIQRLTNDVIDLEHKKGNLKDTLTLWNAQLADLGQTIDSRKQQLMRMDKQMSQLHGIIRDTESSKDKPLLNKITSAEKC
jgi:chromosome segregation ATPase